MRVFFLYICIYAYMHICMCVCTYTHPHPPTHPPTHTHTHTHYVGVCVDEGLLPGRPGVYTCICIYTYTHTHTHINIICMYVCMYVHLYIYIIHTHIFTDRLLARRRRSLTYMSRTKSGAYRRTRGGGGAWRGGGAFSDISCESTAEVIGSTGCKF
jgi:hypothetical protein